MALQTPGNTQTTATAQYTHSTLLNPPTGQWLLQGGGKGNNFMHGMAHPAGDLKLRHHSH